MQKDWFKKITQIKEALDAGDFSQIETIDFNEILGQVDLSSLSPSQAQETLALISAMRAALKERQDEIVDKSTEVLEDNKYITQYLKNQAKLKP